MSIFVILGVKKKVYVYVFFVKLIRFKGVCLRDILLIIIDICLMRFEINMVLILCFVDLMRNVV